MKKIKVSIISYLNTSPFVYGLKHSDISGYIELQYDTPANCAERLLSKDADIGIVPSAVIPAIPDQKIISDYCIGASGAVRSVIIASNQPIDTVKKLYLDFESRTSVILAQLLLSEYLNLDIPSLPLTSFDGIDAQNDSACVLIGDKVFEFENRFKYKMDLAQTWKEFTGMPFVFAAWTAVSPVSDAFAADFNAALSFGLNNIPSAVGEHRNVLNYNESIKYLTENIDYNFNFAKRQALIKFWNMSLKLKSKYRSCLPC
jgi:chorismate dehydratase